MCELLMAITLVAGTPVHQTTTSIPLSLQAGAGTEIHRFIGAAEDLPTPRGATLGAGLLFLDETVEVLARLSGGWGHDERAPVEKVGRRFAASIGAAWLPIGWSVWRMGAGLDVAVSWSRLQLEHDGSSMVDQIVAAHAGITVRNRVNVGDLSLWGASRRVAVIVDGRFATQTVLRACSTYAGDEVDDRACRGRQQLETMDYLPLSGAAVDVTVLAEVRL